MQRKILRYLITTFAITWLCWVLLIVLYRNSFIEPSGWEFRVLFLIGGFGPTLAGIAVKEPRSLRDFVAWIFKGTFQSGYALKILLILILGAALPFLQPKTSGITANLMLVVSYIFWSGGNEELGWRGFLQPALETQVKFSRAVLMTGAVWTIWHLPLWFIPGEDRGGIYGFISFFGGAIVLSLFMALIKRTGGSVFDTMLFHGLYNYFVTSFVPDATFFILQVIAMVLMLLFSFLEMRQRNLFRT